jgi:hypothetical protein
LIFSNWQRAGHGTSGHASINNNAPLMVAGYRITHADGCQLFARHCPKSPSCSPHGSFRKKRLPVSLPVHVTASFIAPSLPAKAFSPRAKLMLVGIVHN